MSRSRRPLSSVAYEFWEPDWMSACPGTSTSSKQRMGLRSSGFVGVSSGGGFGLEVVVVSWPMVLGAAENPSRTCRSR
ncbi:hypothetical protein PG985_011425 [Apiospora marii]|uniref:uncharacterized protein n=1 Tax=Apiospora marii TaxID=335849 RepID=UPI003131EA89